MNTLELYQLINQFAPFPWNWNDDTQCLHDANGDSVIEFHATGLEQIDLLHEFILQQVN